MRLGLKGKLALVLGGTLVLAFAAIYFSVSRFITSVLVDEEFRMLRLTADTVTPLVMDLPQDRGQLNAALESVRAAGGLAAVQVLNAQLETVAPAECTPAEVMVGRERLQTLEALTDGTGPLRSPGLGSLFAALRPLPGGGHLFLARPSEPFERRCSSITTLLMLWGVVLVLALIAAGSVLMRHVLLRPIDRLLAEAGAVATGGRELLADGVDADEFGVLRTSLKTMAERIRQDRKRIEQQVEELTRVNQELTQAQEQLIRTEKLASVGQLAAGVAHEIGNPISIILGYLDLLEKENTGDAVRQTLSKLRKNTERIDRTLRNLMDFSHPAGDEKGLCSIAHEVREVMDLLAPQKAFSCLEMRLEGTLPPGVSAAIPPSRFKQVLLNLLINAADALAGKGRIVVTMARKDDRRIQISVADNGPGIPADIYLKVFDPFFTTKGVGKGTGLGLFVCHTIVSRYGGEIALESKPGQGATFTVTLPMMV